MNPIIQVEHFSKKYGNFTAVDDISFTVDEGSIFAFLGPNGAGKSTTINTLCTILDKTEGRLIINGHDVSGERDLVRKDIGIVFQDSTLDTKMTVEENLKYHCSFYKVPKNEVQERIDFALGLVELTDWKKAIAGSLSGGMKRRLGIAQALLDDPQVLIVDEPTAGLDPEERLRFYTLLDEFSGSRTVVVSSHIMSDIEAVCENVAVLFAGTVEELAKKAEGKVFELAIPKKEQDAVKRDYHILSSQSRASDVRIRVLADRIPSGCPVSCVPTAWDGYMELLRQLEKGVGN